MDLEGVISDGRYFNEPVNMTGPLEIAGGLWCFAKVTTNGFSLTITGGNTRGIYIDGVKQDAFVFEFKEPLALAVKMYQDLQEASDNELKEALFEGFRIIVTGAPTLTAAAWVTAFNAWAVANDSPFQGARFQTWIGSKLNPAWTWEQIRDFVQGYDADTWRGLATQVVEVIS